MNKFWCPIVNLPSGNQYALGTSKKKSEKGLAMYPLDGDVTELGSAPLFVFNTKAECKAWMKSTSELSQQGEDLMAMCEAMEVILERAQ